MPHPEHIGLLLSIYHQTPLQDTHLRYTIRQGLRDTLRDESVLSKLSDLEWSRPDATVLADVLTGVDHPAAADFLLSHLQDHLEAPAITERYLRHAALHVPEERLAAFAGIGRKVAGEDAALEMDLFEAMHMAARQRGLSLSPKARAWGEEIVLRSIEPPPTAGDWRFLPAPPAAQSNDPWAVHPKPSADGKTLPFLSSRPLDETFTGLLRSPEFTLPSSLSFYLAGHAGFPDQPPHNKNVVYLRSAADGTVVRTSHPPRSDIAVRIEWNLEDQEGTRAYIELVDGDPAHAYAWLAAGRFNPPVVEIPKQGTGEQSRLRLRGIAIAVDLRATKVLPILGAVALNPIESDAVRLAAAKAVETIDAEAAVPLLVKILADQEQPASLRNAAVVMLAGATSHDVEQVLTKAIQASTEETKLSVAAELASTEGGRARLLDMAADGTLPARILLEPRIEERLLAGGDPRLLSRHQHLTAGIPPVEIRLQQKITKTSQSFSPGLARPAEGRKTFSTYCTACHQTGGKGGLVGPQLDGIANWGPDRLIEKIIAPNRNVSQSFRYSTVSLTDGSTFTGLLQREEGELMIFADATGKETAIAKSEIIERRESAYSIMPSIFGDTLSEEEIHDLVAYLLTLE